MPAFNPQRRALFQRLASPVQFAHQTTLNFPRPPGAVEETIFLQRCTQCKSCIEACPSNAITLEQGYPTLQSANHCKGCHACVLSCDTGALERNDLLLTVDHNCDPAVAAYCQSCVETCSQQAIMINSGQQPTIDTQLCNRCGLCEKACDFQAIHWQRAQ
ncbi:4Fe-4S binding protein [Vibrio sp. AK197]